MYIYFFYGSVVLEFPSFFFFVVRDVDEATFDQRLILSRLLPTIFQYVQPYFEIRTSIRFYESG